MVGRSVGWPLLRLHWRCHKYVCPPGGDVSDSSAAAQGGVYLDDRRLFAGRTNSSSREFSESPVAHRTPVGHGGAVLWAECLWLPARCTLAAHHQPAAICKSCTAHVAGGGPEPLTLRSDGMALAPLAALTLPE